MILFKLIAFIFIVGIIAGQRIFPVGNTVC